MERKSVSGRQTRTDRTGTKVRVGDIFVRRRRTHVIVLAFHRETTNPAEPSVDAVDGAHVQWMNM